MLRVGLTGGIGAGKSTVAARLNEHGAVHIDADRIAREVVAPGSPGLAELVSAFGENILTAEGVLDRAALAAKAFADESARRRLDAIMHPRIGARTAELLNQAAPDAIVVHDLALLVESDLAPNYHLVIVVDADEDVRVRRLVESRGMAEQDARARIAAQASATQRRAAADVWLDNSGDREAVLGRIDALWSERLVPFEANIRFRRVRPPQGPSVVPPDPTWGAQAQRVLARLRRVVGERVHRVEHIGSTSIPGLAAKDVLDLQLVVPTLAEADDIADTLSDAGFVRHDEQAWSDQGLGDEGWWSKRVHVGADPGRPINLHVRPRDSPAWRRAVLFRDWMRSSSDEVSAYAELKYRLAEKHAADGSMTAYAEDKQPWVDAAFGRAEKWAARTGWEPGSAGITDDSDGNPRD